MLVGRARKQGPGELPREFLGRVEPTFGPSQHFDRHRRIKALVHQPLMRGRVIGLHKGLMHLFELQRGGGQGELIIVQAPLHIEVGFHQIFVALALGTEQGVGLNLQSLQDGSHFIRGERAA